MDMPDVKPESRWEDRRCEVTYGFLDQYLKTLFMFVRPLEFDPFGKFTKLLSRFEEQLIAAVAKDRPLPILDAEKQFKNASLRVAIYAFLLLPTQENLELLQRLDREIEDQRARVEAGKEDYAAFEPSPKELREMAQPIRWWDVEVIHHPFFKGKNSNILQFQAYSASAAIDRALDFKDNAGEFIATPAKRLRGRRFRYPLSRKHLQWHARFLKEIAEKKKAMMIGPHLSSAAPSRAPKEQEK
jgi:hypothetical protein